MARFLLTHTAVMMSTAATGPALPQADPRWTPTGRPIVEGGYACQPYCTVLPRSRGHPTRPATASNVNNPNENASWLCVMTVNSESSVEGAPGEHMVAMRTTDRGESWSPFTPLEPFSTTTTAEVSAYGSVAARPDGSRVFAYWIQNDQNVTNLPGHSPSTAFRADMLGHFVWKFSDDGGRTWSPQHYAIPTRTVTIDRGNPWNGSVMLQWQVDHMKTVNGSAYFGFTKIGTYAVAPPEEIFFLHSPNLLTEPDPEAVVWEMWPDGSQGVRAIGGTTAAASGIVEEPHIVPLTTVDAHAVVFRTSDGVLGYSRSTPGNPRAAWRTSTAARYLPPPAGDDWVSATPNASAVKNPRGPISPKRQPNGLVLMTYYNNGGFGKFASHMPVSDRAHMWLTVGYEVSGELLWTQPELVLYDLNRSYGHGYPDIITDGGEVFITESYKGHSAADARTHTVPSPLITLLYNQRTIAIVAAGSVAARFTGPGSAPLPDGSLPDFETYPRYRYGFTFDAWVHAIPAAVGDSWAAVFWAPADSRVSGEMAVAVSRHSNGTTRLRMVDSAGAVVEAWTDPVCSARLASAGKHHVAVVVDGGPKMVVWVVDGHACDGGPAALGGTAAGWSLFPEDFGNVAAASAAVGTAVLEGRLYSMALHITECIGNWRAGYPTHRAAYERHGATQADM